MTIRQLFKESIFLHEVAENISFEAIPLNNFLNNLSKYKIELDKKDAFCLLNKFKYLEDYESIDVVKLIDELNKYGYEENLQSNSELKEDDLNLFKKLNKFLQDNEVEIEDIFLSKIKKIEINKGEEPKQVVEMNEFLRILKGFKIMDANSNLSEYLLNQICDNSYQYVIQHNLVNLYKKYSLSLVNKEEKMDESKTEDIKMKNTYTQQISKDQQLKNVFDELSENHEPSLGESSPVKDKSKINSYQNLQSFAFSHKPTFGNLHVYENQVAEPDESLNINELEKELDSEVEKFEEIK